MKNRMTEQTAKKTSPQIHCEIAMSAEAYRHLVKPQMK